MTPLIAGRVALLAWSWRRVLLAVGAACLLIPCMAAGVVAQALQDHRVGPLAMPVEGATLTQQYGCTTVEIEPWSSQCATHHFHSGVDLAAALDTPVHAATAGIIEVRRQRGGYGLYIIITRDSRLSTLYGHLDWPLVHSGDVVSAGQPIALMGSTGNSTGPHLHFEVRVAGIPIDPLPFLYPSREGGGGVAH
jgi:murein DD-endopeptidase MepM/ murein hydrolase activator NlpD